MKNVIPLLSLLVVSSIGAQAQIISFASTGGQYPNGEALGVAAIGNTSSDIWNQFYDGRNGNNPADNGYNGIIANALDSTGAATGVDINVLTADATNLTKGGGTSDGGLDPSLFVPDAYIPGSTPSTTGSVSFSGLADNASYELFLYSRNDVNGRDYTATTANGLETFDVAQATTFTSSVAQTGLPTLTNSGLTATGNYIELDEMSDANGDLDVTLTATGANEIDLNGGQLEAIAVPEPSSMTMMLAGIGMLAFVARRRQVAVL